MSILIGFISASSSDSEGFRGSEPIFVRRLLRQHPFMWRHHREALPQDNPKAGESPDVSRSSFSDRILAPLHFEGDFLRFCVIDPRQAIAGTVSHVHCGESRLLCISGTISRF